MLEIKLKRKRRRGMTLVELLGVMVVLAILAGIAIGGILGGTEKARMTSARTALEGYVSAFMNVSVVTPGIVKDRESNWASAETYTGKTSFHKTVSRMDDLLDDKLDLAWNDELKCYESSGEDPWGGRYILTEYPVAPDGSINYFDPTAGGQGMMCFSIWCTGNNTSVLEDKTPTKDSVGVGVVYTGGIVDAKYHGLDSTYPFDGWEITFK